LWLKTSLLRVGNLASPMLPIFFALVFFTLASAFTLLVIVFALVVLFALAALFTFLAIYGVFFKCVVQKACRSPDLWGPRWLADKASKFIYNLGCWYLDFSIDTEDAVKRKVFDPNRQYLITWHPHGLFTIAGLVFFAQLNVFRRVYVVCADLVFKVPLLAEYTTLCNGRAANARTISRLLDTGASVGLQPGGVYEQVHTDCTQEICYFPPKLGFIRLACKHGVPLLPLYVFGENQLFDTCPWLSKVNIYLYKNFRLGNLFVFSGLVRWLPVCLAFPNPLLLCIPGSKLSARWGEPVEVGDPDPDPSDEKVREIYDRYTANLQKLFDTHKNECLPAAVADKGLTCVLRETRPKPKDASAPMVEETDMSMKKIDSFASFASFDLLMGG
jgi:2-acylglycerol O-acyltransferase 2